MFNWRYPDSRYAETTDDNNNQVWLQPHLISWAQKVSPTQTRISYGGERFVINVPIGDVMDYVDPLPAAASKTGKLRCSPDGLVVARELTEGDPNGDWQVWSIPMNNLYYTTDKDNSEIQTWPCLEVT